MKVYNLYTKIKRFAELGKLYDVKVWKFHNDDNVPFFWIRRTEWQSMQCRFERSNALKKLSFGSYPCFLPKVKCFAEVYIGASNVFFAKF